MFKGGNNMALNDMDRFLGWYPAIRPLEQNFIDLYPEEANSEMYAAIRDGLENYD